jgi:hypothetical protein
MVINVPKHQLADPVVDDQPGATGLIQRTSPNRAMLVLFEHTSTVFDAWGPGFAVDGPSFTLGNVVNGPSTTFLCGQRPVHHVGET